eukprot:SAG31_NODE_13_length_37961_cov_21.751307_39_plen_99_part_00
MLLKFSIPQQLRTVPQHRLLAVEILNLVRPYMNRFILKSSTIVGIHSRIYRIERPGEVLNLVPVRNGCPNRIVVTRRFTVVQITADQHSPSTKFSIYI